MKIGILGGGQLAKMLALAGIPLGYSFVFFDPSPDACAASLGQHIKADYDDWSKLQLFAEAVDLVTFEFENVPLATVNFVNKHCTVLPKENALESTQDRLIEKILFRQLGLPGAAFFDITSLKNLERAAEYLGLPLVLKSRFGGYDGKGQYIVKSQEDIAQIWSEIDGRPYIAEEWVSYTREVSVIAARSRNGDCVFYDLVENVHHQGILQTSINRPFDPLSTKAQEYARKLMNEIDYCGVLTLELFQVGDELLVNEFAPRVHNTGHWTIEGAFVSQFENHLRAIVNLPLGETKHVAHCAMVNFVGTLPSSKELLTIPNSHFHQYGKQAKIGRKLGHITICSDQPEVVESYVHALLAQLQKNSSLSEIDESTPT
jgi:5-(carboxyamino)imidazole ribonucleotide synthase